MLQRLQVSKGGFIHIKGGVMQICTTPSCTNTAAYRASKKPAYCQECIDRVLAVGGLKREADFTKPNDFLLTSCLTCGTTAHYRFYYVVQKNMDLEKTCRACFWRAWYRDSWDSYGIGQGAARFKTLEEATTFVQEHGYDLLRVIPGDVSGEELFHVQCQYCSRIQVKRYGDITWWCSCSGAKKAKPARRARKRT